MSTTPPVTLDELVRHLNMSDAQKTANSAELQLMLEAATELVEGRVGPIVTREVTERLEARAGRLWPTQLPVTDLGDVTDPYDAAVTTGYVDAGTVRFPTGYTPACGRWSVTYSAGRGDIADVPAGLKLAVLIVAKHLWETQRGTGSSPSRGTRGYGQASDEPIVQPVAGMGYALPNRALELMAQHVPVVFA